jgi:hypothetical protein
MILDNSENVPEEWIQIEINLCKNADKFNYI